MSARGLRAKLALTLLLTSACASAQSFRVQIVDGKSGKPLAHQRAVLVGDGDNLPGTDAGGGYNTDDNGFLTVSEPSSKIQRFRVYVEWHAPCFKPPEWFPLATIMKDGLMYENTCNPNVHKTVTPGTLVLFVRDETFFEKMAH